jgi:NAD dependent epimerase/dehydratase family enzyme
VLPTPGFAIKAVLGEFADDVLTGQNAIPAVLTEAGFEFRHQDVESALRWTLGR